MTLLRQLADEGKRVFVVTHDLEHLALVDHVLVLRAGGTVAYYGPPAGVFSHFETSTWAETFAELSVPATRDGTHRSGSKELTAQDAYNLPEVRAGLGVLTRSGSVVLGRQLRLIGAD